MAEMSKTKLFSIGSIVVLLVGLGVGVVLAQQQIIFNNSAAELNPGKLNCDPGIDPYNSRKIYVSNNTDETLDNIQVDLHRCPYVPGLIEQYRGSYKCEESCAGDDEACQEGVWDGDFSQQYRNITLGPGESRTFTVEDVECEIIQLDVQNMDEMTGNHLECHNVQSSDNVPPGDRWPGGIAFAIDDDSTGYDAATGTCPQPPTPTPIPTAPPEPTPTSPPPPTPTVRPSATPQPTVPVGQPTNTPAPSPTPIPCLYQCIPYSDCTGEGRQTTTGDCSSYGSDFVCCTPALAVGGPEPTTPPIATSTPVPTRPIAGTVEVTALGILGGIVLVLLAAFL